MSAIQLIFGIEKLEEQGKKYRLFNKIVSPLSQGLDNSINFDL